MSLLDALLLDPFAMDVWVAPRSDGVLGSGSEDDPWDGSVRTTPQIQVSQIQSTGMPPNQLAKVTTATNHGFQSMQVVQISGATGTDGAYYNGTFQITVVDSTHFTYVLWGSPSGSATGTITCQLDPYFFDNVMRALPTSAPVRVRVGPGTLQTKGYTPPETGSWIVLSGMKVLGSGIGVTTIQLVQAAVGINPNQYAAISGPLNYTDSFEASDFTVDCNIAGQPSSTVACGAIVVAGKHTRFRRIRAINFGTRTSAKECFVMFGAGGMPGGQESFDCVTQDCIVEQPGLNDVRETSLIGMVSFEGASMAYHRACVVRNNFIDCEFRQNPVPIAGISYSSGTGLATVTTRLPHGHNNGDFVRVSGALVNGSVSNSFNGSYPINYISSTSFSYTPNPAPTITTPAGDIWLGRFPSQHVQIAYQGSGPPYYSVTVTGTGPYTYTVETQNPHFLVPGQTVKITLPNVQSPFNGVFAVYSVSSDPTDPTKVSSFYFQFQLPNSYPAQQASGQEYIGVPFQGLGADAGRAAVVEGNRVVNIRTAGPYHDTDSSREMVVRNNYYRSVVVGPYQSIITIPSTTGPPGVVGWPLDTLTFAQVSPNIYVAIATRSADQNGFNPGDAVNISGAVPSIYNGNFTISNFSIQGLPNPNSFQYQLSGNPGTSASQAGRYARIWQVDWEAVVNNIIELNTVLMTTYSGYPSGIVFGYPPSVSPPLPPLFPQAVIRRNSVRYVDGASDPVGESNGIAVGGCGALIVEENVVDISLPGTGYAGGKPVTSYLCGATEFFANQSSAGALNQGYDADASTNAYVGELSTNVEDAALLAF